MCEHDFDLCKARCSECNGININELENGIYECLDTGKILKQTDDTTLCEYSLIDLYIEHEKEFIKCRTSIDINEIENLVNNMEEEVLVSAAEEFINTHEILKQSATNTDRIGAFLEDLGEGDDMDRSKFYGENSERKNAL
jgi:hypothetical protein